MQVSYMREFLVTADLENMTKAADKLYLAQPVLSKHIKYLEDTLGGKMFVRSSKGIRLTPLGETAYEAFSTIVQTYDQLLREMNEANSDVSGLIRIGTLNMTVSHLILPLVERFQETYPNVRFSYFAGVPSQISEGLVSGSLDIGLVAETDRDDKDMLNYLLIKQSKLYVAVSSPSAPDKETVSPTDLEGRPLICLKDQDTTNHMNRILDSIGFPIADKIQVDILDLVAPAVVKHNGYFALVDFMLPMLSAYPQLKIIPTKPSAYQNLYLAYRKTNSNPTVNLFLELSKRDTAEGLDHEGKSSA